MRVFVLGAGATGALLARQLQRQGHDVWCGDRDPDRARRFLHPSLPCLPVNARNHWAIVRAGRGCHLLVNATPATFNEIVLRAALRLRAHYFDMAANLGRHPFKAEQLRYHHRFRAKRRAAVINSGLAPGLTNLLAARSADLLDRVDAVFIRLYENAESDDPISTWSHVSAFDEATSRPRIYRGGRFELARRFSEPEWFRFPPPVGRARVVLVAQDEVGTLPHFIPMRELDVKIGGNEIARLRRWYRQGRLRASHRPTASRFPPTLTPRQVARLIRRGLLQNARFAAAVVVRGARRSQLVEHRWTVKVPSLYQLRRRGLFATPIAYATARVAAQILRSFPRNFHGVHPPEALPAELRRALLARLQSAGLEVAFSSRRLRKPDDEPFHAL